MRIFASTPFYVQGPGVIRRVGEFAADLGARPAVVIDPLVASIVGEALLGGFLPSPPVFPFAGELTDTAVAELAARARDADLIVAVGGGKALDAGKAVALKLNRPVISVPTIASTDGPASRGIAMYDNGHRLVRVDQMPRNPAVVVVDTAVIAAAPVRFLRAGIGDAIAKRFEAEACWAAGGLTKHGTRPTHSARAIADVAYRLLRAHAAAAIEAAARRELSEDLEATVEATVLLSAMGFENGGLSIAHGMTRGLMTLRGAKDRLHGEHVAYGALVHVALDQQPVAVVADLANFLRNVGLASSLAELGVAEVTGDEVRALAAAAAASPHVRNFPREVTEEGLIAAIRTVEQLATR